MSNFKKKKHNEKEVGWHSPKEYQEPLDMVREELEEFTGDIRAVLKKKPPKSRFCRKFKGPHVYGLWKPHFFGWEQDRTKPKGWFVRFCTGCNRKDVWIAPMLPGPYWKLDEDARPPGYETQGDI